MSGGTVYLMVAAVLIGVIAIVYAINRPVEKTGGRKKIEPRKIPPPKVSPKSPKKPSHSPKPPESIGFSLRPPQNLRVSLKPEGPTHQPPNTPLTSPQTPTLSHRFLDATGSHQKEWGPRILDLSSARQETVIKRLREVLPQVDLEKLLIGRRSHELLREYLSRIRYHLTLHGRSLRILDRSGLIPREPGYELFERPSSLIQHDLEISRINPISGSELQICLAQPLPEEVFENQSPDAPYRLADLGNSQTLSKLDESWNQEDFILELGSEGAIIHLVDPVIRDEVRESLAQRNFRPLNLGRDELENRILRLSSSPYFVGLDRDYACLSLTETDLLDRGILGLPSSFNSSSLAPSSLRSSTVNSSSSTITVDAKSRIFLGLSDWAFEETCQRLME